MYFFSSGVSLFIIAMSVDPGGNVLDASESMKDAFFKQYGGISLDISTIFASGLIESIFPLIDPR